VITSADSFTMLVGTESGINITATGNPTIIGSLSSVTEGGQPVGLPSGLVFEKFSNAGIDRLFGTPQAGTGGVYSLVISARNSLWTTTQNFTLTIDEAPKITSPTFTTAIENTPFSFVVTSHGFPNPAQSMTGDLPAGLGFVDNGNGTATISGTAEVGSGGVYVITLAARNAYGSTTQSFKITVDEAPTITSPDNFTMTVGQESGINITADGYPTGTATETGTLPAGVTFEKFNSQGVARLFGTPQAGTAGVYDITINLTTPEGSTSQPFTLTVVDFAVAD
jgi:hypothetical protein